jgi:hypothetical protein
VVRLEILFFDGHLDHCKRSVGMNTSKSLSLREIADTTKRVSAPPVRGISLEVHTVAQHATAKEFPL